MRKKSSSWKRWAGVLLLVGNVMVWEGGRHLRHRLSAPMLIQGCCLGTFQATIAARSCFSHRGESMLCRHVPVASLARQECHCAAAAVCTGESFRCGTTDQQNFSLVTNRNDWEQHCLGMQMGAVPLCRCDMSRADTMPNAHLQCQREGARGCKL